MLRPTGITILTILYLVSGGFSLTTSCFAMAGGAWLTALTTRPGSGLTLPNSVRALATNRCRIDGDRYRAV